MPTVIDNGVNSEAKKQGTISEIKPYPTLWQNSLACYPKVKEVVLPNYQPVRLK